MSASVNKVILIGNLGADPEFRDLGSGAEVANLRIATSERWKDRTTGEQKEQTEWHRVSVFGEGLVNVIKNYVKKGSKVYIEGSLKTRTYEKDGVTQYATDVNVQGIGGVFKMLDGRPAGDDAGGGPRSQGGQRSQGGGNGGGGNNNQRSQGDDWGNSQQQSRQFDDNPMEDVPF